VGDLDSIPGLGRSAGGGHDNPFQYSCLENPHRQKSLAGYSPWGHKGLDTTDRGSTRVRKAEEEVKKREYFSIIGRNVNWYSLY